MQVNLYGAVHCSREIGRRMIDRAHGGVIVNISSIHAVWSNHMPRRAMSRRAGSIS
jgi:NAD(P)-dependent dehydrogenase (short-subunit alcohol dehydrogenase family)